MYSNFTFVLSPVVYMLLGYRSGPFVMFCTWVIRDCVSGVCVCVCLVCVCACLVCVCVSKLMCWGFREEGRVARDGVVQRNLFFFLITSCAWCGVCCFLKIYLLCCVYSFLFYFSMILYRFSFHLYTVLFVCSCAVVYVFW